MRQSLIAILIFSLLLCQQSMLPWYFRASILAEQTGTTLESLGELTLLYTKDLYSPGHSSLSKATQLLSS